MAAATLPAYREVQATQNNATSTSPSVTFTTAPKAGNLIILAFALTTTISSNPSGFTSYSANNARIYSKIAGSAEGTTYSGTAPSGVWEAWGVEYSIGTLSANSNFGGQQGVATNSFSMSLATTSAVGQPALTVALLNALGSAAGSFSSQQINGAAPTDTYTLISGKALFMDRIYYPGITPNTATGTYSTTMTSGNATMVILTRPWVLPQTGASQALARAAVI